MMHGLCPDITKTLANGWKNKRIEERIKIMRMSLLACKNYIFLNL